jgi:chemotaxis protein methyltransferase CheR
MNKLLLNDSTFELIADFIYEKSGIYIPSSKKYLVENRLSKMVEDSNAKGFDEFFYMVKFSPNGKETERLIDAITTNETFFFREAHQFDVFIEDIVSRVMEDKKATNDIRVWSAASSTGEEPYTIAMLMKEKRYNVRADIIGSDINVSVLDSARRAVYTSYSIRNVPELYLKKYFTKKDQEYMLDSSICDSVSFRSINLLERGHVAQMAAVDIIFCRNVLIYFDEKAKQKAVSYLYDSLRPGGFLFIGSSESLHNVTRAFMPVSFNKVLVYQKV